MNILKRVFCRVYQGCFYVAMPLMPWRKPKLLKGANSLLELPALIKSLNIKKAFEDLIKENNRIKIAVSDIKSMANRV